MEILPLADRPTAIPSLAQWFHEEWHCYDGRSRATIENQLRESLNRESLPSTWIAINGNEVIGTVSLDESDLPGYDHLSPWLASLYVLPSSRRAGVGRALVRHVVGIGRQWELSPIYLWTPGPITLYEQCGWQVLGTDVYAERPITLMQWTAEHEEKR